MSALLVCTARIAAELLTVSLPQRQRTLRATSRVSCTVLAQGEAHVITKRMSATVAACDGAQVARPFDTPVGSADGVPRLADFSLGVDLRRILQCEIRAGRRSHPSLVSRALAPVADSRRPTSLVQPPNGRTLVNFATNFYTEREEFTRNVRLLGQRIELRITPSQFTWHFDDGESTTTTSPGTPYPDLEVTHDYLEKGGVQPARGHDVHRRVPGRRRRPGSRCPAR